MAKLRQILFSCALTGFFCVGLLAFADNDLSGPSASDLGPSSVALVLSGGYDPDNNNFRYGVTVKQAAAAFEGAGQAVTVASAAGAQNGMPNLGGLLKGTVPAEDAGAIGDLILKLAGKNSTRVFNLFISDHGSLPAGDTDPLDASIDLFANPPKAPQSISGRQLRDILLQVEKVNPSLQIHLIGTQCFSGGLQEVASEVPNTCAASSTNNVEPNRSDTTTEAAYADQFLQQLAQNPKATSLRSAHLAGFEGDTLNDGRARLTSTYYMQTQLGMYDPAAEKAPLNQQMMDLVVQLEQAGNSQASSATGAPADGGHACSSQLLGLDPNTAGTVSQLNQNIANIMANLSPSDSGTAFGFQFNGRSALISGKFFVEAAQNFKMMAKTYSNQINGISRQLKPLSDGYKAFVNGLAPTPEQVTAMNQLVGQCAVNASDSGMAGLKGALMSYQNGGSSAFTSLAQSDQLPVARAFVSCFKSYRRRLQHHVFSENNGNYLPRLRSDYYRLREGLLLQKFQQRFGFLNQFPNGNLPPQLAKLKSLLQCEDHPL